MPLTGTNMRTTVWERTAMNMFIETTVRTVRRGCAGLLLAALAAVPLASRADTVASLLGDFTINQYCGLTLAPDQAGVHLAIVFGQLPALRELHQADANGDGVTSQEERDAYVSRLAPGVAEQLKLKVDGADVPLHAVRWTTSLPKEQTGFSLRLDIDYAAALPKAAGPRTLEFANRLYAGRIGWHEISVQSEGGVQAFDGNAFAGSLTGGLTEALQSLPADGPLDERSVQLRFTADALPPGAHALALRAGAAAASPQGQGQAQLPAAGASANPPGWLAAQTARLIALISAPNVAPHVALLALAAAVVLGALHALSPGHGKAIVGAYLVGSRGTPRHAAFLGITVTVTHTLVVFGLGFATLVASRFVVPERLLPVLSLVSGLLVLGMGLTLLVQRWRAAFGAWAWGTPAGGGLAYARAGHHHHHADDGHHHDHGHHHHGHAHGHAQVRGEGLPHAHGSHTHVHDTHAYDATLHSHGGGRPHTHLPPIRDQVTWRGLLALGVSGGLLPCPSAMVLLLAAVALNKTLFGLALVLAFSIGLAFTLTGVGMVFLYARERLAGRLGARRWVQWLPVASAAAITVLGAVLSYGSLATGPVI
jgi:ABC-type nickel/cobalt efflux system permease component RcnA